VSVVERYSNAVQSELLNGKASKLALDLSRERQRETHRRKELGILLGEEMLEEPVEVSIILLLTHHGLEGPPHPIFMTRVSWKRGRDAFVEVSSTSFTSLLRFTKGREMVTNQL